MTARRLLATFLTVLVTTLALCARAQERQPEYRLGPGDIIRIQVYQNPDLTLETRLTENGTISYPLIGIVRIGDMTVASAEQTIAKALGDGGFIQNPQVTVTVQQMRGNHVSVLGQVNKPGRIALETVNVRVSEILAMAGGISSAGADVLILTGVREGRPFHREIELAGIFLDKRLQDDLVVVGGDVIYVHRAPMFYIYGEVNKPGSFRIERGMTVRQALAQAGGPTQRGTERRLGLYRRGTGGAVELLRPDLSDPVQPDDVLYVRESVL
jgi:polysaccharide export outer membrane protein